MADCARPAPFTMSGRRSKCHRDSGCTGTKRAAHNGYALVDLKGSGLAGDAIPPDNTVSGVRQPDGPISHGFGAVRQVETTFRGSQRRK